MGLNTQDMEATPSWWTFPFKPVRVDPGVFDRLDCSLYTAELKFDGWRAVLIAGPSEAELWTREKRRIEIPDSLRSDLDKLRLPTGTVLDGEIWNPEKRGGWKHSKGSECRLTLWDAIRVGTADMRPKPIEARREALRGLIGAGTDAISCVEVLPASRKIHDESLSEAVRVRGSSRSGFVHGLVLKRVGSPRRDNNIRCVEHPDWLKIVYPGMQSE
jgi:ATP-dependent DNA ligase